MLWNEDDDTLFQFMATLRTRTITHTKTSSITHHICHGHLTFMKTSSNGNFLRVTGPLCGEFTGPGEIPAQRPVTRSFDVFFHLHLKKRLSKQPRGWWFETPPRSLWRQCNELRNNVFSDRVSTVRWEVLWYDITRWYSRVIFGLKQYDTVLNS